MRGDTRAQRLQAVSDGRARKVVDAAKSRYELGVVVDTDDAARVAAVRLGDKVAASSGIRYGDHAPVVGDTVLVEIGPLSGHRRVVAIVSRDAGYVATGIISTPAIAATAVPGFVARGSLTLPTMLTYRPGIMVFRDEPEVGAQAARSHLMTPYVNVSGQIVAVFDAYAEVVDVNRTRVTVAATAITVGGIPALDWRIFVLRERADVPRRS